MSITRIVVPSGVAFNAGATLPSTIVELPTLEYLDASEHADLSGTLPASLGDLTTLRVLDLGGTSISGTLPPAFGALQQLETLDFSGTGLSGSLPSELPFTSAFAPPSIGGECPAEWGIGACCRLQTKAGFACPIPAAARAVCAIAAPASCVTPAPTPLPTLPTPWPTRSPTPSPSPTPPLPVPTPVPTAPPPSPSPSGDSPSSGGGVPSSALPSRSSAAALALLALALCAGCCAGVLLCASCLGASSVAASVYRARAKAGAEDLEAYRSLPGDGAAGESSSLVSRCFAAAVVWIDSVARAPGAHSTARPRGRLESVGMSCGGGGGGGVSGGGVGAPPSAAQMALWWCATPLHVAARCCCWSGAEHAEDGMGRGPAFSLAILSASTSMTASDLLIDPGLVTMGPKLAAGGFGAVYRGKLGEADVVLKEVYTQILDGDDESFLREARMLHSLRHPHIISFFGISWRQNGAAPEGWEPDAHAAAGGGPSGGVLDVSDLGAFSERSSGTLGMSMSGSRAHSRMHSRGHSRGHSRINSGVSVDVSYGGGGERSRRQSRGAHSHAVRSQSELAWGLLLDAAEADRARLLIVTEFCPGGSLADVIRQRAYDRDAHFVKHIGQLASTLHWLHTKSPPVIHRDIKPANLLLDANGNLKLCDLGLARSQSSLNGGGESDVEMTGGMGSAPYVPPEIMAQGDGEQIGPSSVQAKPTIAERTSSECGGTPRFRYDGRAWDIYSSAMTMVQLWQQRSLYPRMSRFQVIAGVSQGLRPELDVDMPPRLRALVTAMWSVAPRDRPSAKSFAKAMRDPKLLQRPRAPARGAGVGSGESGGLGAPLERCFRPEGAVGGGAPSELTATLQAAQLSLQRGHARSRTSLD
jgi:serine/threonine protein kinase